MSKSRDEIKRSLQSYIKTYGLEGAEDYIKEMHGTTPLGYRMLEMLHSEYHFGGEK